MIFDNPGQANSPIPFRPCHENGIAYPARAAFRGREKSDLGREAAGLAFEGYLETNNFLDNYGVNPPGFF